MGLFTQDPVTMVPTDQQSAGSTKGHASDLTSTSRSVKDQIAARLFSQAGSAVASLQQQIDAIMQVLRAPVPQPATYAVTDPEGNLIAWIGYNVVDNEVYQGGWFKQFYVGGTDAANAVIASDINGNVTINGATITLIGPNGVILLDPTVPAITVSDLDGNQWAALEIVKDSPKTISAATNASPVVVTINAHGYANGDTIIVAGATGNTAINGYRIIENATTNTFTMTDIAGAVINGNGAYAGTATATRYYAGGLFQSIAIGPTWGSAKLRGYADGTLAITDATITLNGATSQISLDPTTGFITVTQVAGGGPPFDQIEIASGQIKMREIGTGAGTWESLISPQEILLQGDATNLYQIQVETGSTASFIEIFGRAATLATSQQIQLLGYSGSSANGPLIGMYQYRGTGATSTATQNGDTVGGMIASSFDGTNSGSYAAGVRAVATQAAAVGAHGTKIVFEVTPNGTNTASNVMTLDEDGTLDVPGGYKLGGVSGLSVTRSFGTSLTVSTVANGLRGTPGAGQSNTTVVTGVTLNLTSNTFTGGIITA